jgi:transcription initiation factor IIF auxiliary subunit
MTMLRIQQTSAYKGKDWWDWSAWIDGPTRELDAIDNVTWLLHPTFYNPVRISKDRGTKFLLETEGWGVFTLKAKVKMKSGLEEKLAKEIELFYEDVSKNEN